MSDLTIVIGNRNYSSWSLRGWLCVKMTGAECKEIVIPLDRSDTSQEIRRYSPSGQVPVLYDGEFRIWESLAIAEYLAELYPDSGLWPQDREARAAARTISAEMHAGFAALRAHLPMNVRSKFPGRDVPAKVQDEINRITAIWRDCLKKYGGDGPFLFGEPSIADAMYAPVVSRFHTYGIGPEDVVAGYRDAVLGWPLMQEWTKGAQDEPWIIDYAEF